MRVAENDLADVLLLDVKENLAHGVVLDLKDNLSILGCPQRVNYAIDYLELAGADIVVITAGFSRKPDMSREDLLGKNEEVIREITLKIKRYIPNAIIIVVTNPLDIMTYLVYKISGFSRPKVMGMSGVLDAGRFGGLIADELKVSAQNIQAMVMGMHSDLMLPLPKYSTAYGVSIRRILDKERVEQLLKKTRKRGAEIVSYLACSAHYAPSAAVFLMLKAICNNEKRVLPVSVFLEGEYNLSDVCLGVPVKIGGKGIEEIVELELDKEEKKILQESAKKAKEGIRKLGIYSKRKI